MTKAANSLRSNSPLAVRERIFLRLGENGGLGADDHQWILYRGESPVSRAGRWFCRLEGRSQPEGYSDSPRGLKPPETRLMGSTTPSEGGGGGTFALVEQLGPNCAIGTDGRQWIVLKANGRAKPRYPSDGWNCEGYIHSDKRALLSCIKARGLKLSAAGRAALDRQDEKIHLWRLAGSTGKLALAA